MQTLDNEYLNSSDFDHHSVEELLRHYPWFTADEIYEALKRFGNRHERLLAYLDMKSGNWSLLDMMD
jgi:Mor family transcriptional regulator